MSCIKLYPLIVENAVENELVKKINNIVPEIQLTVSEHSKTDCDKSSVIKQKRSVCFINSILNNWKLFFYQKVIE